MIARGRNAILLERELCADASRIIGNLGCAFWDDFRSGIEFHRGWDWIVCLSFVEEEFGQNLKQKLSSY